MSILNLFGPNYIEVYKTYIEYGFDEAAAYANVRDDMACAGYSAGQIARVAYKIEKLQGKI